MQRPIVNSTPRRTRSFKKGRVDEDDGSKVGQTLFEMLFGRRSVTAKGLVLAIVLLCLAGLLLPKATRRDPDGGAMQSWFLAGGKSQGIPSGSGILDFTGKVKYLRYIRPPIWCTGVKHWEWSFLCAIAEAIYLDRTFVIDLDFCLWWYHNPPKTHNENLISDLRLYYDFEHLLQSVKIVLLGDFLAAKRTWELAHPPVTMITANEFHNSSSLVDHSAVIIQREMSNTGTPFWYKVCDNNQANHGLLTRPWDVLWKNPRLVHIANRIAEHMEWDFDAVHVRRGDKINDPGNDRVWPHLDEDTRPPKLAATLRDKLFVPPGRRLYIATDEHTPGFFGPLNETWPIFTIDSFSHLWASGTEWYNHTAWIMEAHNLPVHFDGYMRTAVDYEVLRLAKHTIETFNDLTDDPRGGFPRN